MTIRLNQTDQTVLKVIAAAQAEDRPCPRVRDLCKAAGKSLGSITYCTTKLKRLRYVTSAGYKGACRTLRLHPARVAVLWKHGEPVQHYHQVW